MANVAGLLAVGAMCVGLISGVVINTEPAKREALVGESVTFLCTVGQPITNCRIEVPGFTSNFVLSPGTGSEEKGVFYHGAGLESGQCGVSIKTVTHKNNGDVKCFINLKGDIEEKNASMKLIVAKAPETPVFKPSMKNFYSDGEVLQVECIVANGRPAAKITWFMDDVPLTDNSFSQKTISGNDGLETTSLLLKKPLSPQDNGRFLRCVANHSAFTENSQREAKALMNIQFPPKANEDPINIFGIKIGEDATINVTVQSNPRPNFKWYMNNKLVNDQYFDDDGRYFRPQIIQLHDRPDFYNISLFIPSIEMKDIERDFELEVNNNLGGQKYTVRVSTEDVPQGVDLDIKSIVGIVVSILIVLILIIMVIFAKATNRWCFSGGVLRTDIPDGGDSEAPLPGEKGEGSADNPSKSRIAGESSDTESTDANQHNRSKAEKLSKSTGTTEMKESTPLTKVVAIPKSLRSLLPGGAKNKDKVSQMEAAPEKLETKLEEDESKPLQVNIEPKEQTELVYAELTLKQTEEPENRPARENTEYAEIVYNSQPMENKVEAKN